VDSTLTETRLHGAGVGSFFRPRDVAALGVSFRDLQRLVASGEVEKIGSGLYRLADADITELETTLPVCAAIPNGILCLISALAFHGIGTQIPHEVWMAIDRKARKPSRLPASVRFFRFSGPMLKYGIITRRILGVSVRVTSPARTVVDCFRYRNKIGIDVAFEAARDAVQSRIATVSEIMRAADVCRAGTVVGRYMQALLA
jgi:predicted transcriptional regulator of viral defense system